MAGVCQQNGNVSHFPKVCEEQILKYDWTIQFPRRLKEGHSPLHDVKHFKIVEWADIHWAASFKSAQNIVNHYLKES